MDRINKKLLMAVSCLATMMEMGLVFSFGTLFVAMMDKFQTNRSTTAIVQSLLIGITLIFGAVGGVLISRIGITAVTLMSSILVTAGLFISFFSSSIYFLYVSIGIVTGTGVSMAYVSCLTIAGQIFTGTIRLFCVSAISVSISVGGLLYPFFIEWLHAHFGLYGTFLILSGILCNTFTLPLVCFLNRGMLNKSVVRNNTHSKVISNGTCNNARKERDGSREKREIYHTTKLISVPFISLLFGQAFSVGALNGFIQLMLDISFWKGFTEKQGFTFFVIYNFTNILSRLFPAVVNHIAKINVFSCAIFSAVSGCIGQVVLYFTYGLVPYIVGISLNSVALGGVLSSSLILVVEIIRQDQKPVAFGLLNTINGIVSALAGYSLGKARDITGTYTSVLLTVGAMQLIAGVLFAVAFLYWKRSVASDATVNSRETTFLVTTDLECDKKV